MLYSPRSGAPSLLAVVLAGGRGSRLHDLTDNQPKPALPFGTSGRLIDFTLANIVHSGLKRAFVLTQYLPDRLHDHLDQRWRAIQESHGLALEIIDGSDKGMFNGTADAVAKASAQINLHAPTHVVILAGDHLYQMDYSRFVARHIETGAQVTVGAVQVLIEDAHEFGVMSVDADGRITDFLEKPCNPSAMDAKPGVVLASMGIYVFEWAHLRHLLKTLSPQQAELDFGKHVLPRLVQTGTAYAYALPGRGQAAPLWRDLGTLDAYHAIHADLECGKVPLDPTWPLLVGRSRPPALRSAFFSSGIDHPPAIAEVWTGCSVGEGARIGLRCQLKRVVILPGALVGDDVRIDNAIITSDAVVPDGFDLAAALDGAEGWCTTSEGGIRVISARALTRLAELRPDGWRRWTPESSIASRSHFLAGRSAVSRHSKIAEQRTHPEDE